MQCTLGASKNSNYLLESVVAKRSVETDSQMKTVQDERLTLFLMSNCEEPACKPIIESLALILNAIIFILFRQLSQDTDASVQEFSEFRFSYSLKLMNFTLD
jgi:hypothetical protein